MTSHAVHIGFLIFIVTYQIYFYSDDFDTLLKFELQKLIFSMFKLKVHLGFVESDTTKINGATYYLIKHF